MSTFDPAQHPRAANGEFTVKHNTAPTGALTPQPSATSSVELTGRTRTFRPLLDDTEITLFEVCATRDIPERGVKAGDPGGWVEGLHLPDGTPRIADGAWVGPGAEVYGQARVEDDAMVRGRVILDGEAIVRGNATISGPPSGPVKVKVAGNAIVEGDATILGGIITDNARISGSAYIRGGEVFDDAVMEGGTLLNYASLSGTAKMTSGTLVGGHLTDGVFEGDDEDED